MKLIVREHVNKIANPIVKKYTVEIDAVNSYNKIPKSIGEAKGDLIVFNAAGSPVRFSAGEVSDKYLMTDPTSSTGWKLGDSGGGGAGASATVYNGTGATLQSGTVVTVFPSSDNSVTYPEIAKATATSAGPYYILLDNVNDTDTVSAAFAEGSVVAVRCDTAAVSQGDPLVVSSTSGYATSLAGGTPTIGIAMSVKAAGSVGLVQCRMVTAPIATGTNQDSVSNANGQVYEVVEGSTTADYPDLVSARYGKHPYGIQANPAAASAGSVLLHSRPGDIAMVMADTTEIKIGDWLVPSSDTDGYVRNGNGYGIGVALEAKASGSAGLVKCILFPGEYRNSPRCWYLPSGITEAQVIGAWQFVARSSEAEALININNGTEYALSKSAGTESWNSATGFTIPATRGAGLDNSTLRSAYASVYSGAFGYSGAVTTNSRSIGGILLYNYRAMFLRGYASGYTYLNYPSINRAFGTVNTYVANRRTTDGVLGGNFSTGELYGDGATLGTSDGTAYSTTDYTWYRRVLGQSTQSADSLVYASFNVTALVLYNTALTASQHLELSNNIKALGGAGS